jgi:DNA-binding transcriptional regulator GbsR (MarR family)
MTEQPMATADVDRDPAAVSRFIERFAQVLVDSGMPRIASRIFIALTATDSGRLTAGELAEQLQASPAAISGGVRYLVQVKMIGREREPGSRRDHFRVDDDVWFRTITQRDQLMDLWASCMREGIEALGEQTPAGSRCAESAEFFEFLRQELRQIPGRWDKLRAESSGRP